MNAKALLVLAGFVSWVGMGTIASADLPTDLPPELENRLWTIPLPGEKPGLEGIQLTQEQQEKIEQIQRETQTELEANGLEPPVPPDFPFLEEDEFGEFEPVELSADQKNQLAVIGQTYRQKITEVLTPAQQQQFLNNLPDPPFETP